MSVNNRGKKILLVDDDQGLRTVLAEQLDLYDGFTTIQVGTAAEGMEKAKLAHYDAILLDIGLPDMDGRELCKLMRRQGVRAPVIMLTAADSDADTILGLESGANDYVTKPFRINVLLARLRAHLRQHERCQDADGEGRQEEDPADRQGSLDPEIPVPRRRPAGGARCPAERGLGLQCRRHDPYPRNPHLPPAPEDRARSGQRRHPDHRPRRLPAAAVGGCLPIGDRSVIFSQTRR